MNYVSECKKTTKLALTLENKPEITLRKFIFHYALYSFKETICSNMVEYYPNMVQYY